MLFGIAIRNAGWLIASVWRFGVLVVLLAVLASIPLVQFASLGYLLTAAANLASGKPWGSGLPSLRLAGRTGTFMLIAGLLWIPVWLACNLAYSSQLLLPGSPEAFRWRLGSFSLSAAWLLYVAWAAMRGGGVLQFLWPAPLRFFKEFFRTETWVAASSNLYDSISEFQLTHYWWLGARATMGTLIWLSPPALMMIFALRSERLVAPGLVGFVGVVGMIIASLYLPFTQIQFAITNRFRDLFNIREVRNRFRYAPWFHALALVVLSLLTIPLYLVRLEATPTQLLWLPSLVFVMFSLPIKLLTGLAMAYANKREGAASGKRGWYVNWPARIVCFASTLVYVVTLYVAQIVAGQGAMIMFFQHAYLVPPPLISP